MNGKTLQHQCTLYLSAVFAEDGGDVGPRQLQAQPLDQVERVDGVAHPLLPPALTAYFIL